MERLYQRLQLALFQGHQLFLFYTARFRGIQLVNDARKLFCLRLVPKKLGVGSSLAFLE